MIAQLQIRVGRPVMAFFQHADALQALLYVLFPHDTRPPAAEGDIDWEDGEPHGERQAKTVAH